MCARTTLQANFFPEMPKYKLINLFSAGSARLRQSTTRGRAALASLELQAHRPGEGRVREQLRRK